MWGCGDMAPLIQHTLWVVGHPVTSHSLKPSPMKKILLVVFISTLTLGGGGQDDTLCTIRTPIG
jgi:hypothetical protein